MNFLNKSLSLFLLSLMVNAAHGKVVLKDFGLKCGSTTLIGVSEIDQVFWLDGAGDLYKASQISRTDDLYKFNVDGTLYEIDRKTLMAKINMVSIRTIINNKCEFLSSNETTDEVKRALNKVKAENQSAKESFERAKKQEAEKKAKPVQF